MGRTLESKQKVIADLKKTLSQSQMVVAIDYRGLTVAELTDLRRRLRPAGAVCKVTKNTFMKIAITGDTKWEPMTAFLKESSAFVLIKDDVGGALKAYQDFQKASKKSEMRGGVMEGKALTEKDVKAIADLPSKEQLIAQIAGAINGVATKLAVAINEVPASLGRAVKAVSEKED
jgi:large subunit ribosomal protein L10